MAEYVELYIDQGSDFNTTITINDDNTNLPENVSGYVITSSLRRSLLSTNASSNLLCSIVNAANGELSIAMDAANTSNLRPGNYMFDVRIYNPTAAEYSRLIEGVIFVVPGITKY
jgi:hypothetical protein